jgi:hypothetical protein
MDIEEVLEWLKGSPVAVRVEEVLARRKALFESDDWKKLLAQFRQFA